MNMRGKYRIKEKFGLTIVPKKRIEKEVHYIGEKSTFLKPPPNPDKQKNKHKKDMDDVRKFLPKAPTFFEHSASFPLPRSSPSVSPPPTLNHPLVLPISRSHSSLQCQEHAWT